MTQTACKTISQIFEELQNCDTDDFDESFSDHFWIKKIQPGQLWLEGFTEILATIGPIPVPREITELCEETWDIGGEVAKTRHGWRLIDVWSISP